MADRSIVVRLRAEVSGYKAAMDEAARSTRKVTDDTTKADTSLGRMVQSAQNNRQAWTTAGTAVTAFGALTVAGLGYATTAAMNWESAWAGVTKTVDGSASEMADLEDELRGLARTLPSTHEEIAAVAEAAGQLGVQRDAITGFTRVMVDLSKTTNLSADEAATSIAQMMNVMGTAPDQVDNLGASLVALGNAGASTERDIVQMAQRISGSAKIVGLTEGQVLGLANALASTGIEVEAGGSAVSNIMIDISKAVSANSAELETWASLAGVTAADFADAWRNDPADALATMIEGLGDLNDAGGDVFGTLETLGQTDIRVTRALLSMAGSGDLLRQSLELGDQAWLDNTALAIEAAKRYETTESKIQIARNTINDAAIDIGDNMLPALANLAESVSAVATWFGNLPDPVQNAATILGGATGAVSLAAGGFLLLFPRIVETATAMRTLRADGSKIPGMLTGVTKAAGIAAAAFVVFQTGIAIGDALKRTATGLEETTSLLLDASQNFAAADALFNAPSGLRGWYNDIDDLESAVNRLVNPSTGDRFDDWAKRIVSFGKWSGGHEYRATVDEFNAIGDAFANLVQTGNADTAAGLFAQIGDVWEEAGGNLSDLEALMPTYIAALTDAENQQRLAAGSAGLMSAAEEQARMATEGHAAAIERVNRAIDPYADYSDEALEALNKWREGVSASDASFVNLQGAYDSVIEKQKAFAQSSADNSEDAEDSWEDFYDGQSVSAEDYIAQLQAQVDAQAAWEQNMLDISTRVRWALPADMQAAAGEMVDELLKLGPEGAAQVQLLHDMTGEELAKVVGLFAERGAAATAEFTAAVEATTPPVVKVSADWTNAYRELMSMQDYLRQVTGDRTIRIATGSAGQGGLVAGRADGGPIVGPGTETSDSILARLSTQEHVWSAREVRGAGGHGEVARMRALARTGNLPKFFDGGSPARYAMPVNPGGGGPVSVRASLGDVTARMAPEDIRALGDYILAASGAGTSAALRSADSSARYAGGSL